MKRFPVIELNWIFQTEFLYVMYDLTFCFLSFEYIYDKNIE
jgi:hypothetical protein